MPVQTILWRRLDIAGHDACRFVRDEHSWRIEGTAVFIHDRGVASLSYEVECDEQWRTRKGAVRGWVGSRACDVRIARTHEGHWLLNEQRVLDVDECLDLDLGFTPATNFSQLKRVALEVGEAADVPVAWLDVPDGTLEKLDQRYERRASDTYWYEAPRFDYRALLRVGASGFVEQYPGLWEVEASVRPE
jgi:hypothetical protein